MGDATITRVARTALGKCSVCLRRRATSGHPTCGICRKAIAEYSATRYTERRRGKIKRCMGCGIKSVTYLCEGRCAPRRRKRRMREAGSRS